MAGLTKAQLAAKKAGLAESTGDEKELGKESQYVTQEQLNKVTDSLMNGMDAIMAKLNQTPVSSEQKAQDTKVSNAGADEQMQVPPNFRRKAEEILGELMDHCEIVMPAKGGTIFTVVIKPEFSNAPKDYLERYKQDRRSKEIGGEGEAGVEEWCKLVKANLSRKK